MQTLTHREIMTKSILGLVAVLLTATAVSAQTETTKAPGWRISSFGLNVGTVHDIYQRMNLDMMYDFTQNPALLDRDLAGMDQNIYRESNGSRLGLNVTLTTDGRNDRVLHELRLGAFYSNREPMISFYDPITMDDMSSTRIIYCNIVNEVSLDGAYLLRKQIGRRGWLSAYAGLGMTLGTSFNNELVVMESTTDSTGMNVSGQDSFYEAKSSLFTRVNIPIGFQATILRKVNFNLETNLGVGVQSVFGGRSYFMPLTTGMRIGLSYNL